MPTGVSQPKNSRNVSHCSNFSSCLEIWEATFRADDFRKQNAAIDDSTSQHLVHGSMLLRLPTSAILALSNCYSAAALVLLSHGD